MFEFFFSISFFLRAYAVRKFMGNSCVAISDGVLVNLLPDTIDVFVNINHWECVVFGKFSFEQLLGCGIE